MKKFLVVFIILVMSSSLAFAASGKKGKAKSKDRAVVVSAGSGGFAPAAGGENFVEGRYWAFIIGIDKYKQMPELSTAVRDAKGVREVLLDRYGFASENVVELYDKEASRESIIDAFYRLTNEVGKDDSLFIYYAGHGHYDTNSKLGWWIPVDGKPKAYGSFIPNSEIIDYLKGIKARHIYLVSDSCFSGTLFGEASRAIPAEDRYMKTLYETPSRWGFTSGNREPVADNGKDGHSLFAYYFIKTLKDNAEPYIIPSRILDRVAPLVANNSDQTPVSKPIRNLGDEGGQFVFRLASYSPSPSSPPLKGGEMSLPSPPAGEGRVGGNAPSAEDLAMSAEEARIDAELKKVAADKAMAEKQRKLDEKKAKLEAEKAALEEANKKVEVAKLVVPAKQERPSGEGKLPRPRVYLPEITREIVVDYAGYGDFRSIGEAVIAASSGTKITVKPGIYREAVTIEKDGIVIEGEPGAEIRSENAHAITFTAANGAVRGLKISTFVTKDKEVYGGLYIKSGRLLLEGCEVTGCTCSGMYVSGGDPVILSCSIHDNGQCGITVSDSGKGIIQENDIYGNASTGIIIKTGGVPLVRNNKIHDGKAGGIHVYEDGKGTVEGNDIYGNATAGIQIQENSDPLVRNNTIRDGKNGGIIVYNNGKGTIEGNEIYRNAYSAVEIKTGGDPLVRNNKINDGKQAGIYVHDNGKGTIENNDLRNNGNGAFSIAAGCVVTRSGNQE